MKLDIKTLTTLNTGKIVVLNTADDSPRPNCCQYRTHLFAKIFTLHWRCGIIKKRGEYMSNDFKWYESMFMMMHNNPTKKVNAEYVEDIKIYLKSPVASCDKKQSLKLLKQFARKDFPAFWNESVNIYLPAVSEGTMKIAEKVYSHDDAICYAKNIISTLDPKELAKAFLYGVAHNAPEYRTALACYYYIKNLPEHQFEKKFIGTIATGDVYSENNCEVCKYNSKLSDEPKMQFWHINVDMEHFYFKALIPFCFNLNTAIVYLEEYKTIPTPNCSSGDLQFSITSVL